MYVSTCMYVCNYMYVHKPIYFSHVVSSIFFYFFVALSCNNDFIDDVQQSRTGEMTAYLGRVHMPVNKNSIYGVIFELTKVGGTTY
jgi:hypothetical protein